MYVDKIYVLLSDSFRIYASQSILLEMKRDNLKVDMNVVWNSRLV